MKRGSLATILCLTILIWADHAQAGTDVVLSLQGYVTPEQNFYFNIGQALDPSATSGRIGYVRPFDIPRGTALGVAWLSANDDGDVWIGPGIWPSWSLTDRLALDIDTRYLFGWGDTRDVFEISPWLQYRIDQRNSVRLQAALSEISGDGESQPWTLGGLWIYHLDESTQLRLGYQDTLSGESDPTVELGFAINL